MPVAKWGAEVDYNLFTSDQPLLDATVREGGAWHRFKAAPRPQIRAVLSLWRPRFAPTQERPAADGLEFFSEGIGGTDAGGHRQCARGGRARPVPTRRPAASAS